MLNLCFADATREPSRLVFAERSYLEVLKYPPPDDSAAGYAGYQLGRVLAPRDEHERARDALKGALEWTHAHPAAPGVVELAHAIRAELL